MNEVQYTINNTSTDFPPEKCPSVRNTTTALHDGYDVELCAAPDGRWHDPRRNWKKSQKKIRLEKRRRG